MAKVVSPILANVVVIGKPKESQFNPGSFYRSVLFHDTAYDIEDEKGNIWKNLTDEELGDLRKGNLVQLVPAGMTAQGKPKHSIVIVPDPSNPPINTTVRPATEPRQATYNAHPPQTGLTNETKRDIASYVEELGNLYQFCFRSAKEKLQDLSQCEETHRAAASSLFIAASRKFNL